MNIPDEKTQAQWEAMAPKKKVAGKLVIWSDKGKVLLVKPTYKKGWQFPGGAVEVGESPTAGLIREIKEETNLVIHESDILTVGVTYHVPTDCVILLYELQIELPEDSAIELQAEEIEAYKFVDMKEVPKLVGDYYADFWADYTSQD